MSEWLGKSKITEEDIKKSMPTFAEFFPMITQYFVDNQKMRIILVLPYDKGDEFRKAVTKKFGVVTPSNIKKAAAEAIDKWITENL